MATTEYVETDFSEIVASIQAGSKQAQGELYARLSKGMRFLIHRKLGPQDVDDVLHVAFLTIVEAIRAGKIKEPEALLGFSRTIVNRQIAETIGLYIHRRNHAALDGREVERKVANTDLHSQYIANERREQMQKCLQQLSQRDREILHRFYVLEQPKEQICAEMNMTETSFRLMKSRAKAKLTQRITAGMATLPPRSRAEARVAA
jgi:RNA polymerase sigma-70 factor, ECF subfamily